MSAPRLEIIVEDDGGECVTWRSDDYLGLDIPDYGDDYMAHLVALVRSADTLTEARRLAAVLSLVIRAGGWCGWCQSKEPLHAAGCSLDALLDLLTKDAEQ